MAHATVSRCLRAARAVARRRGRRARRCGALSGPALAICCRWTPSAWRALHAPGTSSPATARRTSAEKKARVGWEFCHSIIDDHSRLVYTEMHRDERAATVTGFVERALGVLRRPRHHRRGGCRPTTPLPTSTTAACANCSPSAASSTAGSRPAPRSATARSSATSRPSPANGPTDSATAQAPPAPPRSPSGSTTTTPPGTHSALGNRPPISRVPFGRTRARGSAARPRAALNPRLASADTLVQVGR